ncbi:MAG: hypothetical protein HEP71_31245 [Roseivirga sp.]|nr:hypothetical protein [Roseivirga sp.]
MKRAFYGLSMALIVVLASCDSNAGFTELESGYAYRLADNKDGKKAVRGDIMLIHLKSIYDGDSVMIERTVEDGFFINPYGPSLGGFKEVLDLCDEGDSIVVKMSWAKYESLTRVAPGPGIDTSKMVSMHMRIEEIENESIVIARVKEEQRAVEKTIIEKYMADNNLEGEESADGIYQVVREEGDGPKAQPGQQVSVNYVLRLIDGKLIDTNYEEVAREAGAFDQRRVPYRPYAFTVGNDDVIPGWHKGIPLVKLGGKSTLIIPSELGYGPRGRPGIPQNAILVFDVEVVDIK